MNVHVESLIIPTAGRGFVDFTAEAERVVSAAKVTDGVCHLFLAHTSASLVIQENADPAVLRDLERWMDRLAPESSGAYEHSAEGPDDMPAHLRASLLRSSESVPIQGSRLALGTWQALYVWEHRRAAHRRRVVVTVLGR